MATATMMEVPESQRLIALSLGKIAASRGQKGGINLHKNLLVATVLTKARAAYMIQHMNAAKQQRVAAPTTSPPPSPPPASSTCVEMKEAKPELTSSAGSSTTTTTTSSTTSSATSSAAAPTSLHSSPAPTPAAPQSVAAPQAEAASVPEGAAGCRMQVAEIEDKENTPPPSSPCRGDATSSPLSQDCEKRLQGDPCVDTVKEGKPALSPRAPVSHAQHGNTTTYTRDFVSRPASTCCLLKRRRAMDRDHENVSAPKVRIVEARVSDSATTTTPEPMQCDSPQISNLVNIFNTGFSGLSGASSGASGDVSVRNVGQSILSSVSSHHKLSDSNNLTCAKEMTKVGLDSLHHPLVLSV